MQIFGPFRLSNAQAAGAPQRIQPQKPAAGKADAAPTNPVDQLDLSSSVGGASRLDPTSSLNSRSEIRIDKVADLRRQIADGGYDSPEKIDAALDKFLDQYV